MTFYNKTLFAFIISFRMDVLNFQLKAPCLLNMIGPSGTGKTFMAVDLVKRRREIFDPPPQKVLYIYTHWQPIFDQLASDKEVTFSTSMKSIQDSGITDGVIVIDDQPIHDKKSESNKIMEELALHSSHHNRNVCIYFTYQIFNQALRLISLNSQYLMIFAFRRNKSSVSILARHIAPTKSKFLMDAYMKATENKPYGYLFISVHPHDTSQYWVRSTVFPVTSETLVFTER